MTRCSTSPTARMARPTWPLERPARAGGTGRQPGHPSTRSGASCTGPFGSSTKPKKERPVPCDGRRSARLGPGSGDGERGQLVFGRGEPQVPERPGTSPILGKEPACSVCPGKSLPWKAWTCPEWPSALPAEVRQGENVLEPWIQTATPCTNEKKAHEDRPRHLPAIAYPTTGHQASSQVLLPAQCAAIRKPLLCLARVVLNNRIRK